MWSRSTRAPACILAIAMAAMPTAAQADQFRQAADNARIDCVISKRELTRIALIGDQFASVSKISSGTPFNDFAVTHEPVRGDIYLSVPETYAAASLSFFATTKKGFVYKFACKTEAIDAEQLFVTNPALANSDASTWEHQRPREQSAVRLIQAMANDATIDGFEIRQSASTPARVGDLEVQLLAEYRGAALLGKTIRLTNRGRKPLAIAERDVAPKAALAVSIAQPTVEPGASTVAYVVGQNGETNND